VFARHQAAQAAHGKQVARITVAARISLELFRGVPIAKHDGQQVAFVQSSQTPADQFKSGILAYGFKTGNYDVTGCWVLRIR
jgi:hypothetical protein